MLLVFDNMMADKEANGKINSNSHLIVLKAKKTQQFPCFYITILRQSTYKTIRLNVTDCFIMKIPNKFHFKSFV